MDGFRERINGKFEHSDRSVSKGSRYERSASNRTQKKRDDISISDIVNAIEKSNRNQLEKITGLFNDAKVDRLESERSILNKIAEREIKTVKFGEEIKPEPVAAPVVVKSEREEEILQKLNILVAANFTGEKAEETVKEGIADIASAASRSSQSIDTATLMRIERIVGQNSEALSENEDVITKNYEILRSYSENFKEIDEALSEIKNAQSDIVSKISDSNDAEENATDDSVKELVEKTGLDIKASQEEIKELIAKVSDTVRRSVMEASSNSNAANVVANANPVSPTITMQPNNSSNEEIIDAIKDNRALLNMIRQDLLANAPAAAAANEKDEEVYLTADEAQRYFSDLTEHVHVQCVKTYRNVQANMSDQAAQINRNIDKSISELRLFTIASVCLNVVTIVLVICSILGIFS